MQISVILNLIKENYTNLKNKIGTDSEPCVILMITEKWMFFGFLIITVLGSYYKFLVKYEKEYKVRLSVDEEKVIEFVSKKLASGKRIQELQLLKRMLTYSHGFPKLGLFAEHFARYEIIWKRT